MEWMMNVSGVAGAGMRLVTLESQESLQAFRDASQAQRQRAVEATNERREVPPPQPVPTGTDTSHVDLWL
jgi:hypothetical protein